MMLPRLRCCRVRGPFVVVADGRLWTRQALHAVEDLRNHC